MVVGKPETQRVFQLPADTKGQYQEKQFTTSPIPLNSSKTTPLSIVARVQSEGEKVNQWIHFDTTFLENVMGGNSSLMTLNKVESKHSAELVTTVDDKNITLSSNQIIGHAVPMYTHMQKDENSTKAYELEFRYNDHLRMLYVRLDY